MNLVSVRFGELDGLVKAILSFDAKERPTIRSVRNRLGSLYNQLRAKEEGTMRDL